MSQLAICTVKFTVEISWLSPLVTPTEELYDVHGNLLAFSNEDSKYLNGQVVTRFVTPNDMLVHHLLRKKCLRVRFVVKLLTDYGLHCCITIYCSQMECSRLSVSGDRSKKRRLTVISPLTESLEQASFRYENKPK